MAVQRQLAQALVIAAVLVAPGLGHSAGSREAKKKPVSKTAVRPAPDRDGQAEARLIDIYRMVGRGNSQQVLEKARKLAQDFPNFQLGQLIYGDLLMAQVRPARQLGDVPADLAGNSPRLAELREESRLRLLALRERPQKGSVPAQLVSLSARNKHAIAVDVSKSRLYLFENAPDGLRLIADYYISVGKAGVGKQIEGDQRTPLGVYFVTSNLDPKSLQDLYGAGALPINYPNALDIRRGKTGSGIWLHGTPSAQFSRAPLATDGCVAVANPDLQRIIRTVEIRSTPVVIARTLTWLTPAALTAEKKSGESAIRAWGQAKSTGNVRQFMDFYAADFTADEKTRALHSDYKTQTPTARSRDVRLSEMSLLRWSDEAEVMVATFSEVAAGEKRGRVVRQYWERRSGTWKIVYEGVVG